MKALHAISPGFISLGFFAVGLSCMTLGTCSGPASTAKPEAVTPGKPPEAPQPTMDQEDRLLLTAK
jgi:hypothetical protein